MPYVSQEAKLYDFWTKFEYYARYKLSCSIFLGTLALSQNSSYLFVLYEKKPKIEGDLQSRRFQGKTDVKTVKDLFGSENLF